MIKAILTVLFLAAPAYAGVPYWMAPQASTTTAYGTGYLSGALKVYPSTSTAAAAPAIYLDGVNQQLTVRNGANVSTITGAGFYGNGATLTGIIQSSATGTYPLSISGNAATVTNGVYANGSYSNPSWITSLATSKIDLSTVTTALAGKANVTEVIPSTATGSYSLRVATATFLATAPGNCTAGQYISGLAADGTKTCGTPSGAGDAVLAASQTWTGSNTFSATGAGVTTISSATITSAVIPSITGNTSFGTATATTTFSGWVDIGIEVVSSTATGTSTLTVGCPAGKRVLAGSCYATDGDLRMCGPTLYPSTWPWTTWSAITTTTGYKEVSITCARVK